MRISDWSSDVCSSDLDAARGLRQPVFDGQRQRRGRSRIVHQMQDRAVFGRDPRHMPCHFVGLSGVEDMGMKGRAGIEAVQAVGVDIDPDHRSEEHTSELQSLMRISYAVFCLKKKNTN